MGRGIASRGGRVLTIICCAGIIIFNGVGKMIENEEAAVAAIQQCRTLETLDKMLCRFEISAPEEVLHVLDKCMYSPKTFFASAPETVEDEIEFTKQVFLTGTWRLNEYYRRMGIGGVKADTDA